MAMGVFTSRVPMLHPTLVVDAFTAAAHGAWHGEIGIYPDPDDNCWFIDIKPGSSQVTSIDLVCRLNLIIYLTETPAELMNVGTTYDRDDPGAAMLAGAIHENAIDSLFDNAEILRDNEALRVFDQLESVVPPSAVSNL